MNEKNEFIIEKTLYVTPSHSLIYIKIKHKSLIDLITHFYSNNTVVLSL